MNEIKEMLGQITIRGERQERLVQCLEMAGETARAEIADEYELSGRHTAEELAGTILERLPQELLYTGRDGARWMLRLNGRTLNIEDEALLYTVLNYRVRGWVFLFGAPEKPVMVVPEEIVTRTGELGHQIEFVKKTERVQELNAYLQACLNIYKIFDQKLFMEIWNTHHEEKLEEEELCEFLVQVYMRTHEFWCDEEYIISCDLETKNEYVSLLSQMKEQHYYIPQEKEILQYVDGFTDLNTSAYKAFKSYLNAKMENDNAIEEFLYEIADGCLLDTASVKIVELLNVYHVEFAGKSDLNRFSTLLSDWYNHARLWIYAGHTAAELGVLRSFMVPYALEEGIRFK